jgi:transmembrane sensor
MFTVYIHYLLQKKEEEGTAFPAEEQAILDRWYHSLAVHEEAIVPEMLSEQKEQAWHLLQQQIDQSRAPVISMPARKLPLRRWLVAAAAAVVLLVATLGVFYTQQTNEDSPAYTVIRTAAREKKVINLPDGSVVWINAQSQLRFRTDFAAARQLSLDYGEAFFEVKRDTAHPFEVAADKVFVKVLGTAFNVQAYPGLEAIKVTVDHGKVRVTDSLQHRILTDNEQWNYHKGTGRFTFTTLDEDKKNSWQTGNVYLHNASLNELAVYLKNIYGYDLSFSDQRLGYCSNTLNFNEKDDIRTVLEILKMINNIQYRIEGKTIYLTGTGCAQAHL